MLTYFNNSDFTKLDADKKVYDTPIYGPAISWNINDRGSNQYYYKQSTLEYLGKTYPCIFLDGQSTIIRQSGFTSPFSNDEFYSLDFIAKFFGSNQSYISPWAGAESFVSAFQGFGSNIALRITGQMYSGSLLYNGATWPGSRDTVRIPNKSLNQVCHHAFVFNLPQRKMYYYCDGVLYWKNESNSRMDSFRNFIMECYPYNSPGLMITQIALRKGNLSTDNGQSFPVPTSPYANV